MKLGLECSTDLLKFVQPFADFDWILVDRYLSDEQYAKWYRESDNVKFVDNSVTEKGEPCSVEELLRVFDDCKGTYVIAPDWIGDYQKTIDGYEECLGKFKPEVVIGALQGETPLEALKCLDVYQHQIISVPYRVGGSVKGDPNELMALRRALVVAHIPNERIVHLLGFTSLSEFDWYKGRSNIWGMDTDVPVRAGLMSKDSEDFDRTQEVPDTKLNKDTAYGISRNIALLRKAMG